MSDFSEHMVQLLVDIATFKRSKAKSKAAEELKAQCNLGDHLGQLQYQYSSDDRKNARLWCIKLGITPETYNATQQSRAKMGHQRVNEKKAGIAIFSEFVCVKPLNGEPEINGNPLKVPGKSHISIRPQDVLSLKASALVVVENLETFIEQLDCEQLVALLPVHTLAIFRGSPQFGGNCEVLAREWSKQYSIPRIGFYDYDLAGLVKASEQKHDFLILPVQDHINTIGLKGNHEDLYRQENEIFQKYPVKTPEWLNLHRSFFTTHGGSFTQERLIAHGVKLQLMALKGVVYE